MTDDQQREANIVIGLTRYVLAQASARGIDPTHAASAVLALAAHALREAVGPRDAAGFIRGLATHVEADEPPRRFDA
jgi:hypothetical protein